MKHPYSPKLALAFKAFDHANRQDPNLVLFSGVTWPAELLYGRRMTSCLNRFFPGQSEALQLASRSQHLCRWQIPRSDYPMDRKGYYAWRNRLKVFHGEKAGEIIKAVGYEEEMASRVKALLSKKFLKNDPESQTLEDVICLVFLQFYFEPFAAKHEEDKLISIVQKTWRKMSPQGQTYAQRLPYPPHLAAVLSKALA
ncbi:MAG: DUF4202 domain-containing protein [Bacteroidota bacterium]